MVKKGLARGLTSVQYNTIQYSTIQHNSIIIKDTGFRVLAYAENTVCFFPDRYRSLDV